MPAAWQARLQALQTILEHEEAAEAKADGNGENGTGTCARLPRAQLLCQLRELESEVADAVEEATRSPSPDAASAPCKECAALKERLTRVEHAASDRDADDASPSRQQVEELEARASAAEAEVLDRMQLLVRVEAEGEERVEALETELREVRSKAGARIKQLIGASKELEAEVSRLEAEVGRLREVDELNASKLASLKSALDVVQHDEKESRQLARHVTDKHRQEWEYARALTIRYMELEGEHESLFPALAAAFELTAAEVKSITRAQQRHAAQTSLWGRASDLAGRVVAATQELRSTASTDGGAAGGGAGAGGAGRTANGARGRGRS